MRSRASSGRRRAHRGYVLLTSMVLITLFSVMISSLFALSASVRKTTYRRGMDREALQLAQGGAEVAVASIRDDPTYAGVDAQALGAGSYSVSVTAPTGSVSRRILLAEATVHSSVGTQVRRVR
ncbi:MAG: hypothetical protein FJX77_05810, partial [Armatimonadetes bacterium]|nr:hypothetical protein [Armatimonadota bacterium]